MDAAEADRFSEIAKRVLRNWADTRMSTMRRSREARDYPGGPLVIDDCQNERSPMDRAVEAFLASPFPVEVRSTPENYVRQIPYGNLIADSFHLRAALRAFLRAMTERQP